MKTVLNATVRNGYRSHKPAGFYATVIVAVFSFATMYFGLQNRIELLSQKLEHALQSYVDHGVRLSNIEMRITAIEKDLAILKVKP